MNEEKEAIDYLKNDVVYWLDKGKDFVVIDIGENEKLHSILNLIEKQQKEIEEKTTILLAGAEKVKQLEKEIKKYKNVILNLNNNWISKEELKNILEKLKVKEQEMSDEQGYWGGSELQGKIEIIEELLEEN